MSATSPIKTYLVDDEPLARLRMKRLLAMFDDVEITGEFGSGIECIEATLEEAPDLVFLDIGLPDHSGLEVVSELAGEMDRLPAIVFATAYDEHAITAFELNALDYLLKPVSVDRLALTMDRVRQAHSAESRAAEDEKLRNWMAAEAEQGRGDSLSRIEIRERGGTTFVPIDEIHLFQADGNYIEVHAIQGTPLLRMTMAKLEGQLDSERFVRVSRSAIVAAARVVGIERGGRHDTWVRLDTGDRVGATRNLAELEERIRSL